MSPTAATRDLSKLARGGALNLFGAACAGTSGIALVVVVTHSYSQSVVGAFFAATSLFLILSAVSGLGSDAGLLLLLPRYLALGDHAAVRRILPIALGPILGVSAVCAAIMAATAPWLADLIGSGQAGQTTNMLWIMAAFLPVAGAHDAILAASRGHGTMRPTALIEKIFRQAAQIAGVLVAQTVTGDPTALALAWCLPYLPGLVVAAVWYQRLRVRDTPVTTEPGPPGLTREFWRYTAPRAVAQICQNALQRADIVLLAALSSPRNAAIYTAATRFLVVGQLAAQAMQQVLQPMVSRLLTLSDRDSTQKVFAVATTWIAAITWPLYLIVSVGAPVYLSTFGSGYSDAGEATTIILALTMLFASVCGPVDTLLLMAGRSGLSLANNTAALAVDLALNVVLIPSMGATGAAIAWAAALVTRNLLPLLQVRSNLGMSPFNPGLLVTAGAAGLCFGVLPLAGRLTLGTAPGLLAGLLPGTLLYGVLLWAGRRPLSLTAFGSLLKGRGKPDPVVVPDENLPRRTHVHGL